MKRALVTGGSGSIGAAICRRLAADGLHVIVHGHGHHERAAALAEAIRAEGGSAESTAFDVTDESSAAAILGALLAAGPVQVVINNAGIYDDAPLAGMTGTQWRRVVDVSLHGFFNVTRPLLLPMLRSRWGRIVIVSSVAGVLGNRGQANYAAAKAGLHGATRSLALECASRGVTVNAVAPGFITAADGTPPVPAERIAATVPMRRAGRPEDVADLIGFLASDRAGYITGQIIRIDGGLS